MCCNMFSLKPTRSMCDGRHRFFAAWRVEAPFSAVSRFDGSYILCFSLIRGVVLHESPSCSREDSLDECWRPCNPLSCLLFSALWLLYSHSFFVLETQSAKDLDLRCSTTFLLRDATCLHVGPMSLDCPVDPFGRSDASRPSLPSDVPSGDQQRGAFPASIRSRWRQGALQAQPQILQRTTGWDGCGPFLSEGMRCITWNTRGLVGSVLTRQEQIIQISQKTLGQQHYFSRKCMERTSFFRLSRCWRRNLVFLVPFFLTMRMRRGSAMCIRMDLLSEGAVVSHVITCYGRDHLCEYSTWTTQSGDHNRPFWTWTCLAAITWQIASYSPALACISQWSGRYFGWFQHLWSGRRTF